MKRVDCVWRSVSFDVEKTVRVQRQLAIKSRSHEIGMWSNDNTIEVEWHPPSTTKGLGGFLHAWDQIAETSLWDTITLDEFQRTLASRPLEDGNSHYFHLNVVDKNNNFKTTSHLGPFLIDIIPPSPPLNLKSSSHQTGIWTALNKVTIDWTSSQDETSGLLGHSILWNQQPVATPPEIINVGNEVTEFVTPQLPDGQWYAQSKSDEIKELVDSHLKDLQLFMNELLDLLKPYLSNKAVLQNIYSIAVLNELIQEVCLLTFLQHLILRHICPALLY